MAIVDIPPLLLHDPLPLVLLPTHSVQDTAACPLPGTQRHVWQPILHELKKYIQQFIGRKKSCDPLAVKSH
jgi:hypothetical protein